MNDYLHNLVARTLQLSPVVRPRLPSLFEPMGVGQAVNASPPPETHEDEMPVGPAPEAFRPSAGPPAQSVGPLRIETGSQPETTRLVAGPTENNPGASARALPRPSELSTETQQIAPSVASQTLRPEPPAIRKLIAQGAQPPVAKDDARASMSEFEANGSLEHPRFETRRIDSPGEERSRGRRVLVETTATPALAASLARPAMQSRQPKRLVAAHRAETVPAPDTTPTINVTIGRVDVRAVFPQTKAQPARRAHPAPMSLDEYLKQRSGGHK